MEISLVGKEKYNDIECINGHDGRESLMPSQQPTKRRHHSCQLLARWILTFMLVVLSLLQLTLLPSSSTVDTSASFLLLTTTKNEFLRSSSRMKRTTSTAHSAIRSSFKRKAFNASDTAIIFTAETLPAYHVVFSTSCSAQQDWESMTFFYHAWKVGQRGTVTRIVSGCNDQEAIEQQIFHERYIKPMSQNFHVHLTPDFSRLYLAEGKRPYKYMNKPYGLRHWMENSLGISVDKESPPELEDGIIMLVDPDMILLRPLTHDFRDQKVIWVEGNHTPESRKFVHHGNPIGQQDGYLNNKWLTLPLNFTKPPFSDGPKHYNSGPPYLATVRDMYKITVRWTVWAPKVLEVYPQLFAEMFGFILATVELKLPFTFIRSMVVSTTTSSDREGWPFIDALADDKICAPISEIDSPLPIGLHYCRRYLLGKWFWSKYRIKKNIMSCEKSLLRVPESDIHLKYDYFINPPKATSGLNDTTMEEERHPLRGDRIIRRESFMLCHLIPALNEALRHHKHLACNGTANLMENYTIHEDPSSW